MANLLLGILDKAFNQMSDISILFEVVNGRFKFLKANKAAHKVGFQEERYGRFIEDVLPTQYASTLNSILSQALVSGESIRYEEPFLTTAGRLLGDIVVNPILNDVGICTHILGIGRDITERKQHEEELIRTKTFLDSFLSSTTDGILVIDADRNIIRVNHGFSELFGWKEDETIGLPFDYLGLIPEGYEKEHQDLLNELLQGRNTPSHRTLRTRKDGSLVYVSAAYSTLKGKNGEIIGFIGIYRDITEQVEKEYALAESKQRYQSLVNYYPDAVFQFDLDGHFANANKGTEKLTGYPLEELLHRSFVPFITPDTLATTMEHFHAAVRGETRSYTCAIYNKKGERIEVEVIDVPIIVNGAITGVFGVAKNITEQKKLQNELVQTKETLESFFNGTVDAIDIHDLNQRVSDVNPAFESMYGYTENEVLGEKLSILVPEKGMDVDKLFQSVLDGTAIHGWEVVRRRKDGSRIDVSLSLSPIRNAEGEITSVAAITRDISEKKQAERRIRESEEKYRLIAENMTDLITLFDRNATILYSSPSHQTVLGAELKEGESFPAHLIHKEDVERVSQYWRHVLETQEQGRIEYRIKHGEDYFVWLDTKLTPLLDANGEFQQVLCVSRDITERKQQEAQLEKMAFYDYLTGASNRRLFMDRLHYTMEQAKCSQESFAVMCLDFDRFKWVNDTLGHDIGDELLIHFVERVQTCLRKNDTLARLGGDEFAILLPGVSSSEEVGIVAQRILKILQKPWKIQEHEFITTSSIGVCMYPLCGEDTSTLMRHADQALYKAKQSGRNNYQICGHGSVTLSSDSRVSFRNDIKRGLRNNEFYLVYQPQFNLSTGRVESVEALIRWEHPTKGLIAPNEFIPRAEELDLIVPITHWVLKQVGMQVKKWEPLGFRKIPIAVNISAKHIEQGTLIEDVVNAFKQTGLDPQSLIVEITERTMLHNMDKTNEVIQALREMGVKIAIDDFGTGFSSLSYLVKLYFDILKLDKSFTQNLTDQRNAFLVQAIVSTAHTLGLCVVAEGIETEVQSQLLTEYGCDIGQGYFFSKPLISEQLEKVFFNEGHDSRK